MDDNFDASEEFVEEFFFNNTMEDRRLELFNQVYGEDSSTTNRRVICRDRDAGHERLERDYFAQNPVYPLDTLRLRLRMGRHVFLRIVDALSDFDPYFQQRVDALGKKGLSPLQKCTVAICMLAYGIGADAVDDYVRIGKSTTIECLKRFVTDVISIFESEYL